MRKIFLWFCVSTILPIYAQLEVTAAGDLFLGNFTNNNIANYGNNAYYDCFVKSRGVLYQWQPNNHSLNRVFKVDLTGSYPAISGKSFNTIVFCRTIPFNGIVWNDLYLKNIYITTSSNSSTISRMNNTLNKTITLGKLLRNANHTATILFNNDSITDNNPTVFSLRKQLPELMLVSSDSMSIDNSKIIPLLTDAIQTLEGKLINLSSAISDLKNHGNKEKFYKISPIQRDNNITVQFDLSEIKGTAFAVISSIDGSIIEKKLVKTGSIQSVEFNNKSIWRDAGIYRCTLYIDGKIAQTENFVITQ